MRREGGHQEEDRPGSVRRMMAGAVPLTPRGDACPRCGGKPGRTRVKIQVWKRRFFTPDFTDQRWRVEQATSPPLCAPCGADLKRRRTLASVLSISPLLLLLGFAPPSKNNLFSLLFFFFYGFYLAKWGSYTWADLLLYGAECREYLGTWIPELKGKVQFPAPASQCVLRLALCFVGGFLALMARELLLH